MLIVLPGKANTKIVSCVDSVCPSLHRSRSMNDTLLTIEASTATTVTARASVRGRSSWRWRAAWRVSSSWSPPLSLLPRGRRSRSLNGLILRGKNTRSKEFKTRKMRDNPENWKNDYYLIFMCVIFCIVYLIIPQI